MTKKLQLIISLSATLGLIACSNSSSDTPTTPTNVPTDSSGATPTTNNKILGADFRVGKTLAFVEEIPGTEDSFVSVHMFEEGVDVNCENITDQEPRNVLHVTSRLEMNKAVRITEQQIDSPTTPPERTEGTPEGSEEGSVERPSLSAETENPVEREEGRRETSMEIPEGYERSDEVAQAVFLNTNGEQDIATEGYLIVTSRTENELRGIIAAKGKSDDRVSQIERTEFTAEICPIPAGGIERPESPEGEGQTNPENPESESGSGETNP